MIPYAFSKDKANFDRFGRFCEQKYPWVIFENGEVAFSTARPRPEDRKYYEKFGISIFMPGDSHAPNKFFSLEGEPIPLAQLNAHGNPYLLWDLKHDIVKELKYLYDNSEIPFPIRSFAAYWASPDSKPVASPILYRPVNVFTSEERSFVMECGKLAPAVSSLRAGVRELEELACRFDRPSIGDIKKAISAGIAPMSFLEMYGDNILDDLSRSPIGTIKRETKTLSHMRTKP